MKPVTVVCYNCASAIEYEGQIARTLTCPKCSSYVKCCLNCTFYDARSYNECREPQAERIKIKEQANFCGYFEPNAQQRQTDSRKHDSLKKLNDLFNKK